MFIRGERPSVVEREVIQLLNDGSTICAQSCDAQMGAKYVVQVFLLCSIILALAGHAHSQQVAVKLQAGVGVPHHDGSVIDAEKELAVRPVPFCCALIRRELKNLHGMLIWILEVEGRNTG